TGIGIEKEKIENMFGEFTQADTSTTRKFGGTGLGLAISKKLSELMGGEIGITSVINEGSTFWFSIPFAISEDQSRPLESSFSAVVPYDIATERIKILLAEDNVVNTKVAVHLLEKMGYEVFAVENGLEVLETIEETNYSIILMDCQMPEMDGYEATRKIRNDTSGKFNPDIPIVALTANALKGEREKCLDVGMEDFINKPIVVKELREAIEKWAIQ
ncbi:MAG: response regulator, partial [Deltaproteobacteria bacterium]|nr:response regulator [Deltaproteobacteria bacterium]